jgi:2,5-dihydroxypyridine 5,6-dioxygenase
MLRRNFVKSVGISSIAAAAMPKLLAATESAESKANPGKVQDLIPLFVDELKRCAVKPGETVLFYSQSTYARPEYIGATLSAARVLGADAFAIEADSPDGKLLSAAFQSADLIVGQIPLYTDAHNAALARGTRTLMLGEAEANLRRMFPNDAVIKRTYAGAKRMATAKEIRITDSAGSDFTLRKDGRKGHAQVGVSDKPGRWDHWPSGLVACGPLEDSAQGTYVVQPGDVILGLRSVCQNPIRITLDKGRLTKIEGSSDARMLREHLQRYADVRDPNGNLSDPFRVAHAGWGTEHRANWHVMGMDSESLYGSVMVSLGRNMFDSKDEHSGLGGKNYTPVHVDICCRDKKLYLDGELIVDTNRIVAPALA